MRALIFVGGGDEPVKVRGILDRCGINVEDNSVFACDGRLRTSGTNGGEG
jgi:hypothetical protein